MAGFKGAVCVYEIFVVAGFKGAVCVCVWGGGGGGGWGGHLYNKKQ